MLTFTEKFTLTPSEMTEADVEALREAGLTTGHSLIDTAIAYTTTRSAWRRL